MSDNAHKSDPPGTLCAQTPLDFVELGGKSELIRFRGRGRNQGASRLLGRSVPREERDHGHTATAIRSPPGSRLPGAA